VRSDAATVDEYLAAVPANRRSRLLVVRQLCRDHLPDHDETMRWGMPVYVRAGSADFGWANQARYISLYVMKQDVVVAHADRLAQLDMGRSCLRIKPSGELDVDLLRDLLVATAAAPDVPPPSDRPPEEVDGRPAG
jgi:uncharacterized protein YdhG (YjbR/CyaY superfamily)